MKKFNLKGNNGAISADAFIAILIIVLFAGLIATLTYNIFMVSNRAKRDAKATSLIIELFEYIDKEYYATVTEDNLVNYINSKYNNLDTNIASARNTTGLADTLDNESILDTQYKIEINIIPYSEEFDLVKTVEVTVKYMLGTKEQTITMKKVKAKENVITPNEPNVKSIELEEGYNYYPVKYTNDEWKVTNINDTSWYNYSNGYWATIFITNQNFNEEEIVGESVEGRYCVWIPKFAYSGDEIKYLFQNTNNFVNDNGDLEAIDESVFTIANEGWIETDDTENPLYSDYVILESAIGRLNS